MTRRKHNVISREQALQLLRRAPIIRLASTDDQGRPLLRTVHGVVVGDLLAFHAAPKGEKTLALGREAVAVADEVVASIPSAFTHPERACPATTWYRSAMVRGRLEAVEALDVKAAVLQALMEKLQPHGGYTPITAEHPMYAAAVRGLLVAGLRLDELTGKANLGQHKPHPVRQRILAELWRRGGPSDAAPVRLCLDEAPETPRPEFLQAPPGFQLVPHLGVADVVQAVELLTDTYWNRRTSREALRAAQLASAAWVGARDGTGQLVGTARAISDAAKHAWVYDVAIAPAHRGEGLGRALMRLLLDHPAVRHCSHVHLSTRDAQAFYARFGFEEIAATWRTAPDGERWLQHRMHLQRTV